MADPLPYKRVHALVVALQVYRSVSPNSLTGVAYARADATAFADTLRTMHADLDPSDVCIELIFDKDASLTALKDTISYTAYGLGADDLFVLYYAGHGYHTPAGNRLTAYDTNTLNLSGTTLDLREDVLQLVEKSKCTHALLFVDACAEHVRDLDYARDMVDDLHVDDLAAFLRSGWYFAAFLSCSPGEKSYSAPGLQHGVWTYHLLQALRGDVAAALTRGRWLTDAGLRDWLKDSVPRYVTQQMSVKGTQTPQAIVSSSNTFAIPLALPPATPENATLSQIGLQITDAYLESTETGQIKDLSGFNKRRHWVPEDYNEHTDAWVGQLLEETVAEDVQEIYSTSKQVLNLRRKDTSREANSEGGSVDTPAFRYSIEPGQSPQDPVEYVIVRRLVLRDHWTALRETIEQIFGDAFDLLVIEFNSAGVSFNDLVDKLEDIESDTGGSLDDNEHQLRVCLHLPNGPFLVFDLGASRLEVAIPGTHSIRLLEEFHDSGLGLPADQCPMLLTAQTRRPALAPAIKNAEAHPPSRAKGRKKRNRIRRR